MTGGDKSPILKYKNGISQDSPVEGMDPVGGRNDSSRALYLVSEHSTLRIQAFDNL